MLNDIFQKIYFFIHVLKQWFLFLQVGVSMMLSIIKQITKDTDIMFVPFSVMHSQSDITGMVKEFVRFCEELFLLPTSV